MNEIVVQKFEKLPFNSKITPIMKTEFKNGSKFMVVYNKLKHMSLKDKKELISDF